MIFLYEYDLTWTQTESQVRLIPGPSQVFNQVSSQDWESIWPQSQTTHTEALVQFFPCNSDELTGLLHTANIPLRDRAGHKWYSQTYQTWAHTNGGRHFQYGCFWLRNKPFITVKFTHFIILLALSTYTCIAVFNRVRVFPTELSQPIVHEKGNGITESNS